MSTGLIGARERVHGAVLGAAIGDALGYPVEFIRSVAEIRERYGPDGVTGYVRYREEEGRRFALYSDDTQMAEVVLRTLVCGVSGPIRPTRRCRRRRRLATRGQDAPGSPRTRSNPRCQASSVRRTARYPLTSRRCVPCVVAVSTHSPCYCATWANLPQRRRRSRALPLQLDLGSSAGTPSSSQDQSSDIFEPVNWAKCSSKRCGAWRAPSSAVARFTLLYSGQGVATARSFTTRSSSAVT